VASSERDVHARYRAGPACRSRVAAWAFFAHGKLDDRPQPIPASAWIDTSVDVDIIEHSICSHEHRTVLSLLWVPERVAGPLGMIV
jgi:hypothetical protein